MFYSDSSLSEPTCARRRALKFFFFIIFTSIYKQLRIKGLLNMSLNDYFAPIAASMGAISATYWGFECKSAKQLDKPTPYSTVKQIAQKGIKASPSIGATVGIQAIAQKGIEKWIQRGEIPTFGETFISATFVALISTPTLAGFNGLTTGNGFIKSIKQLSPKQMGAITTREISFLFSLGVSAPLTERIKNTFGENIYIENLSLFLTGMLGSLAGHPFDTALTRWQNNLPIKTIRQLMRGAAIKACTVGIFFILYTNLDRSLR